MLYYIVYIIKQKKDNHNKENKVARSVVKYRSAEHVYLRLAFPTKYAKFP